MPVSSLDFSLVDAMDASEPDVLHSVDSQNTENSFSSESRSNAHMVGSQETSLSNADTLHCLDHSSMFLDQTITRADAWASLLGLHAGPSENLLEKSTGSKNQINTKKKGLLSSFSSESQSDHDLFYVNDMPAHKDEEQVMRDINRFSVTSDFNSFNSMVHSSYTAILSPDDIDAMRKRLYCLIIRVLRKYPCLHYYQGYHDVAGVVLLVCIQSDKSDEAAFRILEALTLLHLRDFMVRDIALTVSHLKLVPFITESADPALFEIMKHISDVSSSTNGMYYDYNFFPALPSVLTLFSHDMSNTNQVMRVWDFILGHGSVAASAYIYVALLRQFKTHIFKELELDEEFEVQFVHADHAHSLFGAAGLVRDLPDPVLNEILESAAHLMVACPLEGHSAASDTFDVLFKHFNQDSVIMTTSRLTQIPYARPEGSALPDASELETLMETQQKQQHLATAHVCGLLQDALHRVDSSSMFSDDALNDAGESSQSSLSSSFMLFKSASNTVINSSSNVLKKFASIEGEGDGSDKPKRDTLSIYRLSLTIGFVGFMLHFLLKQSDIGSVLRLSPGSSWNTAAKYVYSLGDMIVGKMATRLGPAIASLGEYGPVREMTDITQVGLGSLKRSIYAMGYP